MNRERPILFFVNCERTVLFSVKRDQDPPLPPSYISFVNVIQNGGDDVIYNEDFFTTIFRVERLYVDSYTSVNMKNLLKLLQTLSINTSGIEYVYAQDTNA